jgi:hypothetical protein
MGQLEKRWLSVDISFEHSYVETIFLDLLRAFFHG